MRYIFNTTFFVDKTIEASWIEKMRTTYLPLFSQKQICSDLFFSLVRADNNPDGKSFSLQLIFHSQEMLNHFLQHEQEIFLLSIRQSFGDQILYFCSLLEEVTWKN